MSVDRLHQRLGSVASAATLAAADIRQVRPRLEGEARCLQLGGRLLAFRRPELALELYDLILRDFPRSFSAHCNRGVALQALGQPVASIRAFQSALELRPDHIESALNLAVTLRDIGQVGKSLEVLRKLAGASSSSSIYMQLGISLLAAGDLNGAIDALQHAEQSAPANPALLTHLGSAFLRRGDYESAESAMLRALSVEPNAVSRNYNLGVVLQESGRIVEAAQHYSREINLNPSYAAAYLNLANCYRAMGNEVAAVETLKRGLKEAPSSAEIHFNLGMLFEDSNDNQTAAGLFEKAIALKPGYVEAELNLGLVRLRSCCDARAWRLFERRWQVAANSHAVGTLVPLKTTRPLLRQIDECGCILVWGEQGVGDEVMFGSLLGEFGVVSGGRLLVQVDRRLKGLFERSFEGMEFYARDERVPEELYERHLPMGSLGLHLRPTMESFSAQPRGYLRADAGRVAQMREWASRVSGGERLCGISWRSVNPENGAGRSLELEALVRGLSGRGYRLVNLQYGDVEGELASVEASTGVRVLRCEGLDTKGDLEGLAALMVVCDEVVSIGNATAHLAGALGLPVKVLLPYVAPWRWMAEGERCVWYPSARLIRQRERGQWNSVIEEARMLLGAQS